MTNGRSDQGGWASTHSLSARGSCPNRPSSATRTTAAPRASSSINPEKLAHTKGSMPTLRMNAAAAAPSRPTGAKIRTRASRSVLAIGLDIEEATGVPDILRRSAEDAGELPERRAQADAIGAKLELADGVLVLAAALLHHRQGAPDGARVFEVAQHDHRVAEVAHVQRRIHRADQAVLGQDLDGEDAELAEIAQQLMHLQDEEALVRHGVEVAVEAVDDDELGSVLLDALAHEGSELARRHLGRIYLLDAQEPRGHALVEGQADRARAGHYGAASLIERENDGTLFALGRGDRIGERQGRFADAGRADEQDVGAALQPAAQHLVQGDVTTGGELPVETAMVFRRDQAREDAQAAGVDDEVVIAATEVDAAHLDHADTAALGAVVHCELLQKDHAVGDGVQLQVVLLGGEVVEQDDGALALGEEVFQGQDLAAVAQRALGQQAQFRQAVDHHAAGVDAGDRVADLLGGLAKLHLGGVEQGQFLLGIEHGLRRDQLEDVDAVERPAVALSHQLKLAPGFGQGDVEHPFALAGAFQQKLQGDGGLARARPAFVEIEPV